MADNRFATDYGKRPAKCQKCKEPIARGGLRLAKVTANPFTGDGEMKVYHHPACLFETFKRARATTRVIEDVEDIEDFGKLKEEDQEIIQNLLRDFEKFQKNKGSGSTPKKASGATPKKEKEEKVPMPKVTPDKRLAVVSSKSSDDGPSPSKKAKSILGPPCHKDDSFKEFRRLCASVAVTASYLAKTELVRTFFNKGTDGDKFKGDLLVWVRLLLPGVVKRIYNLQSKQLVKIFSRIFRTSEEKMLTDLEKGDVAETIATFFEASKHVQPAPKAKAKLSVHDVDNFLNRMTKLTKEDDQMQELADITTVCTANDLKMVIRLIRGDLRIQAGAKHILEALHKDAHDAFNSFRNIEKVIEKILELRNSGKPDGPLEIGSSLMHPVQPMLAMACKSVDMAFQKCPNGMYSEIKYDGERVQLHKQGDNFKYFSRSLKPVLAHKVAHFKDYIPKAFKHGDDMILDGEVLMVDNNTGKPLPFGTLGKHKAAGFKDATPCLFVFDCIYYNGQDLMNRPVTERRKLLMDHMVEVGNNIKFSEMKLVTKKSQLSDMIKEVLQQGLEGLVLKDLKSTYEPGKRHWLKVKKDYLNEGAMADSADLVVLGAWYGTGNKGGLMSVFLMGCYDEKTNRWYTVTKVHTGHDEATLDRLQKELGPNMVKIKQDYDKVPNWLDCTRQMAPDFIAKDPKASPVWEITGAEFSKAEIHTAAGISIRFPRVTKIRNDKDWKTATSLSELKALFEASKESTKFELEYDGKKEDRSDDGEEDREDDRKRDKSKSKEKSRHDSSSSSRDNGEKSKSSSSKDRSKEKERNKEKENGSQSKDKDKERNKEKENRSESSRHKENGSSSSSSKDKDRTSPHRQSSSEEVVKVVLGSSGRSYDKVQITSAHGMDLKVIKGDLFKADDTFSLAHCISADYKLGKGIAKIFKEKFGRVHELEKSGAKAGGLAVLKDNKRYIYNLVSKDKYSDKGDYELLRQSLEAMKEHAVAHNVTKIAMPKLGCGLDGLSWTAVRTLIKNVFLKEKIELIVYSLDSGTSDHSSQSPSKRPSEKSDRSRSRSPSPKKQKSPESELKTPLLNIFEGKSLTPIEKKKK